MSLPTPNYDRFLRTVLRQGPTDRIPAGEQHADVEIMAAVLKKDPARWTRADHVQFQHTMGYDYVNVLVVPKNVFGAAHHMEVEDGTANTASGKRTYVNEQSGPIASWADFETFPWPKPEDVDFSAFAEYRKLLPPGMKMNAFVSCGYFSKVTWTVGLQPFCFMLIDDRPLIKAIFKEWAEWVIGTSRLAMSQPDIGAFWMSDDLGFNSGPFLPPAELREFIFPVFAEIGRMAKARNLPFILHSCGNLNGILGDIAACHVNCFHSLPPQLYDLAQLKRDWGHKLAFSGNVDLNILGRGTPEDTRNAVRAVKKIWATPPVGGILLSSSNSIANYSRLENYLAMIDEMQRP